MARKTGTKKCISANGGGGRGGCGGGGGGKLEWRTDVIHISYNTHKYKLERVKSNSKQRRRRTKTNTNTEHDVHRVTLRQRLPTIVRLAVIHISNVSHQIQKHPDSRSDSKERGFSTFSSCIDCITSSDMFSDFTK